MALFEQFKMCTDLNCMNTSVYDINDNIELCPRCQKKLGEKFNYDNNELIYNRKEELMSKQQIYQCPNVDCENCQPYNEDELSRLSEKRCPECKTILEIFSYVDEELIAAFEEEENEDENDEDDEDEDVELDTDID